MYVYSATGTDGRRRLGGAVVLVMVLAGILLALTTISIASEALSHPGASDPLSLDGRCAPDCPPSGG